jgi:hypothetical protein
MLLLVVTSALLLGCSAASSPEMLDIPAFDRGVVVESMAEAEAPLASGNFQAEVERLVIRSANLSIIVTDPTQSLRNISQMAANMGGFVVSSYVSQRTFTEANIVADEGSITVRVPSERLDEALERIRSGAIEVQNESISGQDVTDQFTDLQSRLRYQTAAEEQLLAIMSEAREHGDTENVLAVLTRLNQIGQEIEVLKGRIQYLSESARLSSIAVQLTPDVAARPFEIGGWRPEGTVKDAAQALLRALRFLGNAAIWIVIFVLPVSAILIGVPVVLIRAVIRRSRKSGEGKKK